MQDPNYEKYWNQPPQQSTNARNPYATDQPVKTTRDVCKGKQRAGAPCQMTTTNHTNNAISFTSNIDRSNIANLKFYWHIPISAPVSSKPIVLGDALYFTDWEGHAYKINKKSGNIIWQRALSVPFKGTGVICDNIWYIASNAQSAASSQTCPGQIFALDIQTGATVWCNLLDTHAFIGSFSQLQIHNNLIYLTTKSIDHNAQTDLAYGSVVAVDRLTGHMAWKTKMSRLLRQPNFTNALTYCDSLAIDSKNNLLYLTLGNLNIVALDTATGKEVWQNNTLGKSLKSGPILFESNQQKCLGVASQDGSYLAINRRTGQIVWQYQLDSNLQLASSGIYREGKLYLCGESGTETKVFCLDAVNGALIYQTTIPATSCGELLYLKELLLFYHNDLLFAFDISKQKIIWQKKIDHMILSPIQADGHLFYMGCNHGLTAWGI